ncbi:hypothetical protein BDV10DRAFT_32875 [Aspergillus recurvatus]
MGGLSSWKVEQSTPVTFIVGADGIHSISVTGVTREEPSKESTGQNCFRFLITVSILRSNPVTTTLVRRISGGHPLRMLGRNFLIAHERQTYIALWGEQFREKGLTLGERRAFSGNKRFSSGSSQLSRITTVSGMPIPHLALHAVNGPARNHFSSFSR